MQRLAARSDPITDLKQFDGVGVWHLYLTVISLAATMPSGSCPFGKQPDPTDPARLIDHPEEQMAIAAILAARARGKGYKSIAAILEARALPCRGQRWHHTTVRAILRREGLAQAS
jgi:hypothetical protein